MTLSFNRHSEWTQECFVRKTGNGTVTQSEESITRITSYRPLSFSTFSWQLTANGSQLTADSFYLLTAFLITGTDPSLSLRMTSYRFPHHGSKFFAGAHTRTLNVSHHSDSFLQSSFWMDARMLCEKDRKRDSDTEWRIYYLEWHLTVFLTTIINPSLSLRMTPYHGCYFIGRPESG